MRLQLIKSAVASLGFSALAGLGFCGSAAHALTISPVLVELSPARRVASMTISNPGDRPLSFQTQVRAWSQPDGADACADTDELFVVPPIAEEHAYRLIFEDVSEFAAPSTSSEESSISIRVNHDLPVFFAASGKLHLQSRLGPCTNAAGLPATTGCVRLSKSSSVVPSGPSPRHAAPCVRCRYRRP
jgi:fimbrial chaperone protein